MDKKTKKQLSKYVAELSAMLTRIEEIKSAVEDMSWDEGEKFDNAPENLQSSEKFAEIQQIAEDLESLVLPFENATEAIDEIIGTLSDIASENEPK